MSLKSMFPNELPTIFKRPEVKSPRAGRRQRLIAKGLCPDCGEEVSVDTAAAVIVHDKDGEEVRRRPATVAFCGSCEFAMEVLR